MARFRRSAGRRAEGRLDPIRWRRPGRGALLRFGVIAALLITAAFLTWSGPQTCAPAVNQAGDAKARSAPATGSARRPGPTGPSAPPAREGASDAVGPSRGRAAVPPGRVGVPVRLSEPTALALVRPGDHVDLLRVGRDEQAEAVAAAALVLGVTGADDPTAGGLLLALTLPEAAKTVAEPGGGFAVLIRP